MKHSRLHISFLALVLAGCGPKFASAPSSHRREDLDVVVGIPTVAPASWAADELRTATAVTMGYVFDPEQEMLRETSMHQFTIRDAKVIKEMLATLRVKLKGPQGMFGVPVRAPELQCQLAEGIVLCALRAPTEMSFRRMSEPPPLLRPNPESARWQGILFLQDRRFFDKCQELATKHEGRPINFLWAL